MMIRLNNSQYFHFLQWANALRRSGLMCDALILVKNQTFRAHRLVLACASRRLEQKLTRADTDGEVHCRLEDISPKTFQQVLDFAYTQSLEVSEDDLQQLLLAAQFLEMHPLEEQCQRHLDTLRTEQVCQRHKGTSESDEEEELKKKSNAEENLQEAPITKTNITEKTTAEESRKKSKLTIYSRGSVITSSVSNSSSSPWTIPNHMWSCASSLRRRAENDSTLRAAQPCQRTAAHAITFPTPHISPLQGPPFQSLSNRSVVAGLHPLYGQQLYFATTETGGKIKPDLQVTRIKASKKADKTSEIGCPGAHNANMVKECNHCRSQPRRDPASSPSDNECRLNGQDLRGERPYQCRHCPKKFSLKHQLDTHHRIHTGEKPFECRLCGQRSRDFSAIIKHLRTHGGASPYRCTLCLEFCSSLVAMQRHVKSHPLHEFPPDWNISCTYLYMSHISQH
ncbi:zinc finger and BTB domain-containing protein 16 isoform X1 [Hippocampus zosterae]|uniref:zinc finger and BTB domain-containing protein 16 isoform X1 n=2 Tax=Hippocampus zosterae TaxID=109293 RepID=UPI00223DCC37|nr:zinc finger and BTB domain-containing protein 16 isoform X1 [Hippocampus zosterae]